MHQTGRSPVRTRGIRPSVQILWELRHNCKVANESLPVAKAKFFSFGQFFAVIQYFENTFVYFGKEIII